MSMHCSEHWLSDPSKSHRWTDEVALKAAAGALDWLVADRCTALLGQNCHQASRVDHADCLRPRGTSPYLVSPTDVPACPHRSCFA
jgi:hypothetical protein